MAQLSYKIFIVFMAMKLVYMQMLEASQTKGFRAFLLTANQMP
jgi:hypothetical protein